MPVEPPTHAIVPHTRVFAEQGTVQPYRIEHPISANTPRQLKPHRVADDIPVTRPRAGRRALHAHPGQELVGARTLRGLRRRAFRRRARGTHRAEVPMQLREHLRDLGIRLASFIDESVVGILGEGVADALRRFVHPHEVVIPHEKRQREHRLREELRRLRAERLRLEALPRSARAGETRIEGGEAPFGDEHRALHVSILLRESLGDPLRVPATLRQHHVAVEVRPRIAVEGHNVAIPARGLPHRGMRTTKPGESRAHHKMVRVVAADRLAGNAEIEVRRALQERKLHFGGRLARHPLLREERPLRDLCAVRLRKLRDRVEEARILRAAAPPGELVVNEVAKEPGIVPMWRALPPRLIVRPCGEAGMEHVREGRARPVLVRTDVIIGIAAIPAESIADREEDRVDQSPMLEVSVAARAEQIESPRLQALQGVRLPVRLVRELDLVHLVVMALPRTLAVMAPVGDVVDAKEHRPAAKRIDHPPAAVLLDHPEEARRLLRHARHEALACVGRDRGCGFRTHLGPHCVERGKRPAETAVRMQRGTPAGDGLHRSIRGGLGIGIAHLPDDLALRVLHEASNA